MTLVVFLLLFITSTQAAASQTCLKGPTTFYGSLRGTAFSDFNYLVQNESSNWYFRLITVMLCQDDNGNLNGLQGQLGAYRQIDGVYLESITSNVAGNVSGSCEFLTVDPSIEEFFE